jgi:archaellum biogenesis protein FlaJ (TadC family)
MNETSSARGDIQTPPSNYLVGAILCTLFCCQILGIVSIIFAAQVNSKWQAGDYEGARQASRNALTWIWISLGATVILISLALTFGLGVAFLGDLLNW